MAFQAGMGIYDAVSGSNNVDSAGNAISNIGNNVQQESAMSQSAQNQWQNSYGIGQDLQNIYGQQLQGGNPEQNYQQQGPLAQANYNQVLQQAQNPTAGWQNTLAPQLDQAQNQINEYYNARGLDNSGIAIGAMGTAGVDLAIQNAQNEMQYQQQSLQNAGSLSSGIYNQNNSTIKGLQDLYGQQQGYGLQGQGLAQQGYQAGAEYQSYPYQSQLGYGYGQLAAAQAVPGQIAGEGAQLGSAFIMA